MLDQYDGGSGKPSQSYINDQRTEKQLSQYLNRSLTGMPPAEVRDQTMVAGSSAQLAQMDEQTREGYVARAMILLKQPPEQRHVRLAALQGEVSQEVRNIERDPVSRLAAIFNAPVGAQYLDNQGQAQMDGLRRQYDAFVAPGAGDAGRAKALESAVLIKTQMQAQIGDAVAAKDAGEQKAWGESAKRVDQILDEADKYATHTIMLHYGTDDPEWNARRADAYSKTFGYQSIGEKLLSDDMLSQQERDNPGWWPGSMATTRTPEEKARDLLTFQQGLNDPGSAISKRVQRLESLAVHELTANGDTEHYLDQVKAPKLYKDIAGALPEADGHYVQNLAQKYLDTTQDIDQKSRDMLREHTPGILDKVLYGIGKTLNSLIPLPGLDWLTGQLLDAAIPNHGGLSSTEESAIDTTLLVGGLLMGGLEKLPLLKGKLGGIEALEKGINEVHIPETVMKPSLPDMARERIGKVWETPAGAAKARAPQPGDERMAAGSASTLAPIPMRGAPLSHIPEGYAQPQPDAIWNSGRYPGLMEDAKKNTYVVDGKNVYAVKYDADNATWAVNNPQVPSRPTFPIRPGIDGGWELHGNVGLKGGMLGDGDAVAQPSPSHATAQPGTSADHAKSIEETVNSWVKNEDRKYASITQKYDPGKLNLNAFENKRVMVSDEVFNKLTDAQKINEQINTLLPYGSGNQHWDVQFTQGESAKRVSVGQAVAAASEPGSSNQLIAACRAGAGNCSDMARLALHLAGDKFRTSPVMRVRETDGAGNHVDHTYVIVGDPRDPRYGESSVVIDPWPSFPTAHTLGTGAERPAGPVESSRHEPLDPAVGAGPIASTPSIDQVYGDLYGNPAPGSVLLELYKSDGKRKFVWVQRTSGNDMSTIYTSPSNPTGIKLDKLPDYIVERYDPYIQRNDNHRGPLFPAAPQGQQAPTAAQIQQAWDNFLRANNNTTQNYTPEQWEQLAAFFEQFK